MITIYDAAGHSAQVVAQSVPLWLARGWTEGPPRPRRTAGPVDLVVSEELRERDVRTQPSDVTAPGESEVEGVVAPSKSVASAREKE